MKTQTRTIKIITIADRILVILFRNSLTSSQLAKSIGCTTSYTLKTTQILREKGIIEFTQDTKDAKSKPLTLTNKGIRVKESLVKLKGIKNG